MREGSRDRPHADAVEIAVNIQLSDQIVGRYRLWNVCQGTCSAAPQLCSDETSVESLRWMSPLYHRLAPPHGVFSAVVHFSLEFGPLSTVFHVVVVRRPRAPFGNLAGVLHEYVILDFGAVKGFTAYLLAVPRL